MCAVYRLFKLLLEEAFGPNDLSIKQTLEHLNSNGHGGLRLSHVFTGYTPSQQEKDETDGHLEDVIAGVVSDVVIFYHMSTYVLHVVLPVCLTVWCF